MLVGEIEIVPVLDAVGVLGELRDLYQGVPADEWEPYRTLYPEMFEGPGWRFLVTVHLIRSGGRTLLLDTGVGPAGLWEEWSPKQEGLLPAALARLGVHPDDVDVVFLTHLHIDHLGWNADADATVFFPNARYVVHVDALGYATARPNRPQIKRCVTPLLDRFEAAVDGGELIRGVRPFPLPGHYPGHMGLRLESGDARAIAIADIAPHPALLDRTEWVFAYDEVEQTPTRAELVREVVDSDVLVICGHYPGTGIGRVVTRDGRVIWEESA